MHVFFYSWRNSTQYIDQWVHPHFVGELEAAGHRVTVHHPQGDGERREEALLAAVRDAGAVDLFFTMAYEGMIAPETVGEIRRRGIPTVNFTVDNIEVPFLVERLAPHFDICWVPEPEAVPLFTGKYGARVFAAPMAANPNVFTPRPEVAESLTASFCGVRYGSRETYVPELIRRGIDLRVFGKGWREPEEFGVTPAQRLFANLAEGTRFVVQSMRHRYGRIGLFASLKKSIQKPRIDPDLLAQVKARSEGVVSFERMIELYSASKLTLGFNERGNTHLLRRPLLQIRLRDFEATMSGACYLMRRIPEMREYFDEDKEVLFYDSVDELADKIRFYARDDQQSTRTQIRQAAHRRALADHTWMNRFRRLTEMLGIKL